MSSIKKIIDAYNTKLTKIGDQIIKSCLYGVEALIHSPHLCRCISPGEKHISEFYFNCRRNSAEKGSEDSGFNFFFLLFFLLCI